MKSHTFGPARAALLVALPLSALAASAQTQNQPPAQPQPLRSSVTSFDRNGNPITYYTSGDENRSSVTTFSDTGVPTIRYTSPPLNPSGIQQPQSIAGLIANQNIYGQSAPNPNPGYYTRFGYGYNPNPGYYQPNPGYGYPAPNYGYGYGYPAYPAQNNAYSVALPPGVNGFPTSTTTIIPLTPGYAYPAPVYPYGGYPAPFYPAPVNPYAGYPYGYGYGNNSGYVYGNGYGYGTGTYSSNNTGYSVNFGRGGFSASIGGSNVSSNSTTTVTVR